MKRMNHKKALLAAVLVALLLTFTAGGTIAYLVDRTEEVQNTFTPASLNTKINETFNDDRSQKTSITVENESDSISAYVRVAVVGNWCDKDGRIVKPWTADFSCNTANWAEGNDGYYYYKKVLPVGQTTENLLASGETIEKTSNASGYEKLHLEVTVLQQAIQADPSYVVDKVWPGNPIP